MSNPTPIFINPTVNASVSENASKGAKLAFVPAIDPGNNKITYTILSGNINSAFLVDSLGVIKVNNRAALDFYEATPQFNVVVQASNGTTNAVHTVNFQFLDPIRSIIDTNRKANTITDQVRNGDLVNVTASARDGREIETNVQYSLTNDAGGRFEIDSVTGVVTVKNAALLSRDAGNAASHTITIKALNSDGISTFSKNFLIRVNDTNNLKGIPINDLDTRENLVLPNAVKGTVVGITVNMVDPDPYYLDGTITYSLSDSIRNRFGAAFKIDPLTGVITVNNGSLLKAGMMDTVTVTARTADNEFTTQTFTIKVVPPIGPLITATAPSSGLLEAGGINNGTPGINVARSHVSISSWDGQSSVSFDANYLLNNGWFEDLAGRSYIYVGTYGTVFFDTMAASNNVVYVLSQVKASTQALTAGQQVSDSVTFRVIDTQNLTADNTVIFNITGANDFPRTLAVTLTSMLEDSGARQITQSELNFRATDVDGTTLVASALSISAGNGNLVFNSQNGSWSYTPLVNDDTSVGLTYTITDAFGGSVIGSASLDITPVNDVPTISVGTISGVLIENGGVNNNNGTVGGGSASVTLSKTDVDSPFTFFIPGGGWATSDGATYINIGIYGTATFMLSSGLLSYSLRNDDPDTEKLISGQQVNDTFVMGVRDTTTGDNSANISFVITGANDNPNDIQLSTFSIPENTLASDIIATVSGVDRDAGNTLSYLLVPGAGGVDADNSRFEILNGNQLRLISGQDLDFETIQSVKLNLRVTDNTGLSFDKAFVLNVTNVNEAPTSILLGNLTLPYSIDENASFNIELGASDPDANSQFTYELVSGSQGTDTDNGLFKISVFGNQTYLGNVSADGIDFEQNSVLKFNLKVTDNGSPSLSFTQAFLLTVNDLNEAPVAMPDSFIIEDASVNLNVTSVFANDFDPDASQIGMPITANNVPTWQLYSTLGIPVLLNTISGAFIYQYSNQFIGLNPGEILTDSFTYTIHDSVNNLLRTTTTVSIQIDGTDRLLPSIFSNENDIVNFRIPQVNFSQYDPTQFYHALDGNDVVTLPNTLSAIIFARQYDLSQMFSAGSGNDTVYGGDANDEISGDDGQDSLDGGKGNDYIYGGKDVDSIQGGDGNDFILGGLDSDILTGGNGSDKFAYVRSHEGGITGDVIQDFISGVDVLYLAKIGFTGFTDTSLVPENLTNVSGSLLHDENVFVFDNLNNSLYYTFSGTTWHIATLNNVTSLSVSDFLFFN